LSARGYTRALKDFESLHSELLLVGVDDLTAHQAGELAERFALRGYDAIHLASALSLATDTTLVSWDNDLRRAAAASGCILAPPS
jgi:hypothetical protein